MPKRNMYEEEKKPGLRSVLRTIGTLLVAVGGYEIVGGNIAMGSLKVLIGLVIYYIKDKIE